MMPEVRIQDPGPQTTGGTFRTVVFIMPGGRAMRRAHIDVMFDPRMVYCVAVEPPPPGAPSVTADVTIGRGIAAVDIAFPIEIEDPEGSDGVPVATVQWRCAREGQTRLAARADAGASFETVFDQRAR